MKERIRRVSGRVKGSMVGQRRTEWSTGSKHAPHGPPYDFVTSQLADRNGWGTYQKTLQVR